LEGINEIIIVFDPNYGGCKKKELIKIVLGSSIKIENNCILDADAFFANFLHILRLCDTLPDDDLFDSPRFHVCHPSVNLMVFFET